VDVRLTESVENPKLVKDHLKQKFGGKKVKFAFKVTNDGNDFSFICDPRWRLIGSETDKMLLRYVDDGDLLGQCNIAMLPVRPADNPIKPAEFEAEVKKIIGNSKATLAGTEQFTTANGLSAVRVLVNGYESDIPFHWLYYHVSAVDGRRITLVFTIEKEILDRFQNADKTLIDQIDFAPARQALLPATGSTPPG
jgi:hypothetical protein